MKNNRKALAAVGVSTLAILALLGGGLAQFTDRDNAESQELITGTLNLRLSESATWNDQLSALAIDDRVTRTVTLINDGSLPIYGLNFSTAVESTDGPLGGDLAEAMVVQVNASNIGGNTIIPSTIQTPQGGVASTLANVDGMDWPIFLAEPLRPGQSIDLEMGYRLYGPEDRLTLPLNPLGARETGENAFNKYQGASLAVTYTVDAIQDRGVRYSSDGTVSESNEFSEAVADIVGALKTAELPVGPVTEAQIKALLPANSKASAMSISSDTDVLKGEEINLLMVLSPTNPNSYGLMGYYTDDFTRPIFANGIWSDGQGRFDLYVYGKSSMICNDVAMNTLADESTPASAITTQYIDDAFAAFGLSYTVTGTNPWTVELDASDAVGVPGTSVNCEMEVANGRFYMN